MSQGATPGERTVLHLRTTASQKCAAVPRRARIQGSETFASLSSRVGINTEEEEDDEGQLLLTRAVSTQKPLNTNPSATGEIWCLLPEGPLLPQTPEPISRP
jgi:hypothetical protein